MATDVPTAEAGSGARVTSGTGRAWIPSFPRNQPSDVRLRLRVDAELVVEPRRSRPRLVTDRQLRAPRAAQEASVSTLEWRLASRAQRALARTAPNVAWRAPNGIRTRATALKGPPKASRASSHSAPVPLTWSFDPAREGASWPSRPVDCQSDCQDCQGIQAPGAVTVAARALLTLRDGPPWWVGCPAGVSRIDRSWRRLPQEVADLSGAWCPCLTVDDGDLAARWFGHDATRASSRQPSSSFCRRPESQPAGGRRFAVQTAIRRGTVARWSSPSSRTPA